MDHNKNSDVEINRKRGVGQPEWCEWSVSVRRASSEEQVHVQPATGQLI